MGVLTNVELKDKVERSFKFIAKSPHPNRSQLDL